MRVILNSVEKVTDFVNIIKNAEGDIDLSDRRYFVDAKSILGIFSLDLTKPLNIEFHGSESQASLENTLSKFSVAN